MTTQVDLSKVWALTGGTIDPDILTPGKYEDGWVVEIPTYENFNYVLQNLNKNILVGAEQGCHNFEFGITYVPGGKCFGTDGFVYTCRATIAGLEPSTDVAANFWIKGKAIGGILPSQVNSKQGVLVKNVHPRLSTITWDCSEITLSGLSTMIQYNTDGAGQKNWLMGNSSGELVAVDIGTGVDPIPDGSVYNLGAPLTYRLYHEGHKPTQAEVAGTIPDAPVDGAMYARINGAWSIVTTTTVSDEPPPPVLGDGAGWFNLADGKLYIDVDDGDSSQWAPANPPAIAVIEAKDIQYDNTASGLTATTVQAAIDELAALHP